MTRRGLRTPVLLGALALTLGLSLGACGEDAGNPTGRDSMGEPTGAAEPDTTDPDTGEPTETPTESPTETSTEEPEPTGPDCAEVWVAGQVLPEDYSGCEDAEKGKFVQALAYECSSGQRLVTFRRNFYAAVGKSINETSTPLARDPEFKKVLASCGA